MPITSPLPTGVATIRGRLHIVATASTFSDFFA
jgi:hypothetical protein